jgi:multiple sugar transport system substrate-binding protein
MIKDTRRLVPAIAAAVALSLTVAGCGGSGFSGSSSSSNGGESSASASSSNAPKPTKHAMHVLIASSGTAETNAVKKSVAAWSHKSGIKTTVIPASNLEEEAAKGFSSGKPPDLLYVSTDDFAKWAKAGDLHAYGNQLSKKKYYSKLVKAFTHHGQFYCAPKDFSTLQLVINPHMWKKAGLTSADYPKTWPQLHKVATKLTKGKRAGLTMNAQVERIGVFMRQAGGGLTSANGKKATVNSPHNVRALKFLKSMLADGSLKWASQLSAGDGGEAFGKKSAAMTIEGNWITGSMQSDYKHTPYKIVPLPKGRQRGTLQFTNCWGVTAKSSNVGGAISLVKHLTTTKQQLQFSKEFGVMPSLKTAKSKWKKQNPKLVPFVEGASYAYNLPAGKNVAPVIKDFDSKIPQLQKTDPKKLLDRTQSKLKTALPQ